MWPFKSSREKSQEKSCTQCKHFNEYRMPDRLLPNKTVLRGEIDHWECRRGSFVLNDLNPCELFEKNPDWKRRIALPPLPKPPRGSSSVQCQHLWWIDGDERLFCVKCGHVKQKKL